MKYENLIKINSFRPKIPAGPSAWLGHIPFAGWVIRELKPKIFVELGSHAGHSYFAFCQAVEDADLHTKCFAVDTWAGDGITTGHYENDVYMAVEARNKESYATFSSLLQMTFDEALVFFEDASIELLHIDGLHTYDAVRHDFETWLPKLAPGAVVLFHDTVVHAENFGVWKFWEELKENYPRNLEFEHSSGLGVLQIDIGEGEEKLAWLQPGFHQARLLIDYFSALGSREFERYDLAKTHEELDQIKKMATKLDSQVAKQVQYFPSMYCYRDTKTNNKTFMFYEDFLSLMGDDIRIAKGALEKNKINYENYSKKIESLTKSKSIYSFHFDGTGKAVTREQIEVKWDAIETRVQTHHQWLVRLTRLISLPNLRVAVEYEDMAHDADIPILCFHKKLGQNIVLVPDFEIYEQNYYRKDIYLDSVEFEDKLDKALFVGSTTGTNEREDRGCCNTEENINCDPSVRISAAKFFAGGESVIFKLPSVVQCDSQETEAYLKSLTFTQCDHIDWSGQFENKFIISVDGNGPTCTRVAVTLLSHSVLLKYQSQWITYYHRALRPFVNYVPIYQHGDVNDTITELKDNYSFYSSITHRANEDFSLIFKKINVDRFFAAVLNEYYALFHGRDNTYWGNRQRIDQATHFEIEAHFANAGDVWLYPNTTIKDDAENFIQGLIISPASALFEWNDISYQVMYENGSTSDTAWGGQFCGTRGQNTNIVGFRIIAKSKFRFSLFYSGVFSNDALKKVRMGEWLTLDNMFIKCIELYLEPLVM